MFETLQAVAAEYPSIEPEKTTFQEYNVPEDRFDVVVLHNVINHLDEEACVDLHRSQVARETYHGIFAELRSATAPSGDLVVADVTRRNAWADVGLTNPFAETIEWEKHQSPALWNQLLAEHGFVRRDLKWVSYLSALGSVGRRLFSNYPAAYLTGSTFVLRMEREA